MSKYYPIKKIIELSNTPIQIKKGRTHMNSETKLKDVIREEMDKVTKMLIDSDYKSAITLTKWLQSLQRINDVCKERNRY